MDELGKLVDRLTEYSCGGTLFYQADSEMYATIFGSLKKSGVSPEMACKQAHRRVIEKILREELV